MARILIVDDEESILALLRRLFTLHGHEVDTAADGAQAVDLVQKKKYELMLIDHYMPNMTGVEAVALIRSSDKFNDMKILMVTQASVTKEVDEAYQAGVDGYVVKPFEMDRLLEKVQETLRGGGRKPHEDA